MRNFYNDIIVIAYTFSAGPTKILLQIESRKINVKCESKPRQTNVIQINFERIIGYPFDIY